MSDYLKLHFVIFLWGFTAVLGNLIEVSATQLVLYRSVLASAVLPVPPGRRDQRWSAATTLRQSDERFTKTN
jgi:hypothetical protein